MNPTRMEIELGAGDAMEIAHLAATMAASPGTPDTQRDVARQVRALTESLASRPLRPEQADAPWRGRRQGDLMSVLGPGAVFTMIFSGPRVRTVRFMPDQGYAWQFDFAPLSRGLADDVLAAAEGGNAGAFVGGVLGGAAHRVRVSLGAESVASTFFGDDGSVRDERDWRPAMEEGRRLMEEAARALQTPDELDAGPLPDVPPPTGGSAEISAAVAGCVVAPEVGKPLAPSDIGQLISDAARAAAPYLAGAAAGAMAAYQAEKSGEAPAPVPAQKRACPRCGHPMAADARFCEDCGMRIAPVPPPPPPVAPPPPPAAPPPPPVATPLAPPLSVRCPACGQELPPGSGFCYLCGARLSRA